MISVKVKFRPSTVDGKEGSLYYQIIYKRVPRQFVTDYKIKTTEWNIYSGNLEFSQADVPRYNYLSTVIQKIEWDKRRFQQIFNRLLSSNKTFTTDDIVQEFQNQASEITLFNYMNNMISRFWKQGQYRTSETYSSTLNSFSEFRNGVDLYFEDMDSDLLLAYEYHLKSKSLSPNTISFYMKRLRAVYNKAIDDGFVENKNLFRRVFTSSEKTVKRAISLKHIKKLKNLDLSYSASKEFARDIFLFSFYTIVINTVISTLRRLKLYVVCRPAYTGSRQGWRRLKRQAVPAHGRCRSAYLLLRQMCFALLQLCWRILMYQRLRKAAARY